ncbi:MAG: 2-oxoacid:ferredoxin oxidoreductase subunit gamma [Deltaproteobacteria bacterium]|nr:2-oxoacid:ferredoxin oxidoreductase subunit gamma [Deltaproteobacteria bacterium]
MGRRTEVRLAGSGGQGLILAGVILAEAATIYDEKNAVQSQSYGPEARGGASRAEVIISDADIEYPKATELDILLCLTQESCDRYVQDLKPGGLLLVDRDEVNEIKAAREAEVKVVKIPIISTAKEKIGKALVANIVALGALVQITRVVTKDALKNAVLGRVPKGTEDLNLNALESGFELGREYKKT